MHGFNINNVPFKRERAAVFRITTTYEEIMRCLEKDPWAKSVRRGTNEDPGLARQLGIGDFLSILQERTSSRSGLCLQNHGRRDIQGENCGTVNSATFIGLLSHKTLLSCGKST